MTEEEACIQAAELSSNCAPCNPNTCNPIEPPAVQCGCDACTAEILDRDAGGVTCRTLIIFYQGPEGGSLPELDACSFVAGEYPDSCGPCSPCR